MTPRAGLVTSVHNPLVKRARKLKLRKHRAHEGALLVEGIRPVWHALDNHALVERLLWAPELLTSTGARALVEQQEAAGTAVTALGAEAFASLAERDHPSGLAAIVRREPTALHDLEVAPDSLFVALAAPGSPGNIGTIVRALDATGGRGLAIAGDAADPFDPLAIKASMGSVFAVEICRAPDLPAVVAWCRSAKVRVVTTSARAPTELWKAELAPPLMFVLGSEREGLSLPELSEGDDQVRIPMRGGASSLNLAVAAGILLYEYQRRMHSPGGSR